MIHFSPGNHFKTLTVGQKNGGQKVKFSFFCPQYFCSPFFLSYQTTSAGSPGD